MSLSTEWFLKNIREYAELLRKEYELKEELSVIRDKIINLSICMTNDEINEANELFREMMESDDC